MNKLELKGLFHELNFWKGFVKTDRFLKGWVAPIRTPELDEAVWNFIIKQPHDKILDVGCGAVSILNGMKAKITAVDPLGDLYRLIFDYAGHDLVWPVALPAEEMHFDNAFDIVFMRNAIDHTQDPMKTYGRLYTACKPKGFIIISGFCDEGTFEKWEGFHQWDITIDEFSNLIVKGKNKTEWVLAGETIEHIIHAKIIDLNGKKWFTWIAQK